MPKSPILKALVCLSAPLAVIACKEGGPAQCINPADPVCVTVIDVDVSVLSAAEDTVVQVGSTAQLEADVVDNLGADVTTLPIAWSSTTTATATACLATCTGSHGDSRPQGEGGKKIPVRSVK